MTPPRWMHMNIVLIGMRGAGKTTVGKLLAEKLKKEYIETDQEVAKKANMPITDIVAKHGWEYFRQLERYTVEMVAQKDNCIIATGGGVVVNKQNVDALKQHGKLFYLEAPVEVLIERIGDDNNRPSLTGKTSRPEDMKAVMQQRKKLYEEAADAIIETNNKTTSRVSEEIITALEDTYVY